MSRSTGEQSQWTFTLPVIRIARDCITPARALSAAQCALGMPLCLENFLRTSASTYTYTYFVSKLETMSTAVGVLHSARYLLPLADRARPAPRRRAVLALVSAPAALLWALRLCGRGESPLAAMAPPDACSPPPPSRWPAGHQVKVHCSNRRLCGG